MSNSAIICSSFLKTSEINYRSLPQDADIIRFDSFYDEAVYLTGQGVTHYFFDDISTASIRRLVQTVYSGAYNIKNYWYQGGNTTSKTSEIYGMQALKPVFDYLKVLASHAQIASFLLGPHRPALPLQILAWAMLRGYQNVYMACPEIYGPRDYGTSIEFSPTRKKAFELKEPLEAAVNYAFIDLLCTSLNTTTVYDATLYPPKNNLFNIPPLQSKGRSLAPLPKILSSSWTITGEQEDEENNGGSNHIKSDEVKKDLDTNAGSHLQSPFFELRENGQTGEIERCAYVTFCDNEGYLFGCRALANSIGQHSKIPLIVMVPADFEVSGSKFQSPYVRVLPVPKIKNPNIPKQHQKRFENTYSKLNVFNLTFLDKALFIDSDALVFKNIEKIFDINDFAAAPDHGLNFSSDIFNSGVFICQPDAETFKRLTPKIAMTKSYDGGDQGFLNEVLPDRKTLPQQYNVLKRVSKSIPPLFDTESMAILHYVGEKPWDLRTNTTWDTVDRLWLKMLTPDDIIDFVLWLRVAQKKAPNPPQDSRKLLNSGQIDEAISLARKELQKDPQRIKSLRTLRNAYYQKKNYLRALYLHLKVKRLAKRIGE